MQMEAVRRRIALVAGSGVPVHVSGEPGTGKTLVARHVAYRSPRRLRALEIVHAAELSVHALFDALGRLEFGTLVIERLGELPAETSDALEELVRQGRIHRPATGSLVERDVRLITTSVGRLDDLIARGAVPRGLYGRLEAAAIDLTPLRERHDDIRAQGEAILAELAALRAQPIVVVHPEVWEHLAASPLPRNSSQLRSLLADAASAVGAGPLRPQHLPGRPNTRLPTRDRTLEALLARDESAHIVSALRATGSVPEAAARLGVSVATLYRKMKKLGLRP
jgi:DNA-binding NtrC family response regulator